MREYPAQPLVSVGGVVLRDDGSVLLVRRGREPGKGLWSLPGGLVELGETAAEALHREIVEECGVEVHVTELLGVIEPRVRDQQGRLRFHYVILDFLAIYLGGHAHAATDADEVRWVGLGDLDNYGFSLPETRAMIERGVAVQRGAAGQLFTAGGPTTCAR